MPLIPVRNPDISDEEKTYLTADVAAAAASISVADYEGFSDNDYLVLGPYGKEKSEIVQVNDASIDASITLEAGDPVYAHPANTAVTRILWNQVEISSSTSEGGTYSVLTTMNLEVDDEYTYYNDTAGSSSTWYKVRFKNSTSVTYSDYSDAVQAIGYKANSRGRLKSMVKSLFGDKYGKWVDNDDLDNFFYHTEQEVFAFRKKWTFLQDTVTFTAAVGKRIYPLSSYASSIKAPEKKYIENIWIKYNDPLNYNDRKEYDQLLEGAQYTTLTVAASVATSTLYVTDASVIDASGTAWIDGDQLAYAGRNIPSQILTTVTGCGSAHIVGSEIWMQSELDEPTDYTIWGGNLLISPTPDTAYAIHLAHYKDGVVMDEDNDVSVIPWASSLLVNGVLSLCYAAKEDDNMYKTKRAEFLDELKERSYAERLGQKQSLTPSDREGYREWEDYRDFDKGILKEVRNSYRT